MIKVASDCAGIGAFDEALKRLNVPYKNIVSCEIDKYARQAFLANNEEPEHYDKDIKTRFIPSEPVDVFMSSVPCQAFSIAGKRLGKDDPRGVLFFNSLEFIEKNKPRFFIFENVKGLVSHDNGKTFSEWINLLGGKSVNGTQTMFAYPGSVPYHIYYNVLNTKDFNVPQNRERIFIVGIRDDKDNSFKWPKEQYLTRKLKDVLEEEVDCKFYLKPEVIETLLKHKERHELAGNGFGAKFNSIDGVMSSLKVGGSGIDDLIADYRTDEGLRIREDGISPCLTSNMRDADNYDKQGTRCPPLLIKNNTAKGYIEANEGDSVNFTFPESTTRRGRVGQEVSQTIDVGAQIGVVQNKTIRRLTPRECLRLQDFPDNWKIVCSDSQTYKQAGNSITVKVLELILKELKLF